MDLLMFLTEATCDDIAPIIRFIKGVFSIIQIVIPVGLIIMGAWDLGKAVLSSDDKEIKMATSKLIKRAIAAVAVFFLVLAVNLVMKLVAGSGGENGEDKAGINCWNSV